MTALELSGIARVGPFDFRWPDGTESFEGGWSFDARFDGHRHTFRHGVGVRDVYGRVRVHTVTWVNAEVQVEGVEADDYPASQALVSRLRRPGRATARTWAEVPAGYEGFEIVEHRRELTRPPVRGASRSRFVRMTSPLGRPRRQSGGRSCRSSAGSPTPPIR